MRSVAALAVCIFLTFTACAKNDTIDRGMALRQRSLESSGCSFDAVITADYRDEVYTFSMSCAVDQLGDLQFSVKEPISLEGITGRIGCDGGKLTFDDRALGFPILSDNLPSPVSGPWFFITALRSGYLKSCADIDDGIELMIDDSYEEDSLLIDIHTDSHDLPISCEILWDGMRILSMEIQNFTFL